MCAGADFSGTVRNCKFVSTQVCVMHGAAVTLQNCIIRNENFGLTVRGRTTKATLSECSVSDCITGIVVEDGATVEMVDSMTWGMYSTHIIVNDAGSCARIESCTMKGRSRKAVEGSAVVARGGTVRMSRCEISCIQCALFGSWAGTRLHSRHLSVRDVVGASYMTLGAGAFIEDSQLHLRSRTKPPQAAIVSAALPRPQRGRRSAGGACLVMKHVSVRATSGRIFLTLVLIFRRTDTRFLSRESEETHLLVIVAL